MMIRLRALVPADQLVVIHAPLGRVEWPGTLAHIRATIGEVPLILARAADRPSGDGPAARLLADAGDPPVHQRPQTRPDRARAAPLSQGQPPLRRARRLLHGAARRRKPAPRQTTGRRDLGAQQQGRTALDRLAADPSLDRGPRLRGDRRRRRAAALGLCQGHDPLLLFVSASWPRDEDLRRAAQLRPRLAAEYIALEEEIGHTLSPTRIPLREIVGWPKIVADPRKGSTG